MAHTELLYSLVPNGSLKVNRTVKKKKKKSYFGTILTPKG